MYRLKCPVQNYAWGQQGSKSRVAELKCCEDSTFKIDPSECYAELWMGTHPNGPSRVKNTEENDEEVSEMFLIELLETQPYLLGDLEEGGDLPFMFKILSIGKALSIQAHPDKLTAERLYATRPDLYRDDNHKPEMAVALSEFEGLCGFRPFYEIVHSLHRYPELRGAVSLEAVGAILQIPDDINKQQAALKKLFTSYMTAKPAVIRTQIAALVDRLRQAHNKNSASHKPFHNNSNSNSRNASLEPRVGSNRGAEENPSERSGQRGRNPTQSSTGDKYVGVKGAFSPGDEFGLGYEPGLFSASGATYPIQSPHAGRETKNAKRMLRPMRSEEVVEKLILRLSEEYPGDIGIMMPLLLNYLQLKPGECFFMGANEPHAYLRGDIMEVMARSDNVVRVALTPKYRDVPLLCDMLTYKMGAPPYVIPRLIDPFCTIFTPPVLDFELEILKLPYGLKYIMTSIKVPSIFLVLSGEGIAEDDAPVQSPPQILRPGITIFVAAKSKVQFTTTSRDRMKIAIAHTNIHGSLN